MDDKKERDERTLKLLKKYFSFFKIHGYLPKKWKEHILDHLDAFYTFRDEIAAEMAAKDSAMDALSLDDILSIIDKMARALEDAANEIKDKLDAQEENRGLLQDALDSLRAILNLILSEQDDGDWYSPEDFAVYCNTDNSLTFYYGKVPTAGETYSGKVATNVFSNFSNKQYTSKSGVPWDNLRANIDNVVFNSSYAMVLPDYVSFWFTDLSVCDYLDLTYLDTRNVINAADFATGCNNLAFIKVGGNTDIFGRFSGLVSQEYWYTSDSVVNGTCLNTSLSAGTYYTTTPYYNGTIYADVPYLFYDDITVTFGSIVFTLSYPSYSVNYDLPMYTGGTAIIYEISVNIPDGFNYEVSGNITDGYYINLTFNYIDVPITVIFDDAITPPETITVTLRNLSTGDYYAGTIWAADNWEGIITIPGSGDYDCISENFNNQIWDIQGDIYNGFTIVYMLINQQDRISYTVVWFSETETKNYSDGGLTVETDPDETSFADGVLTLPAYLA